MLRGRLFSPEREDSFPLSVGAVGLTVHKRTIRPDGYAAVQLFLGYAGQGIFRFYNLGDFALRENDCLIVPRQTPHEYFAAPGSERPWKLGYLALNGDRIDELLRHFGFAYLKVMPVQEARPVWRMIERIWRMADDKKPAGQREASKQAYGLLAELREQCPPSRPAGGNTGSDRSEQAVRQACSIINEHYAEPMLISLVAKTLGFTHQHLNRRFKKQFGTTLYQYLQRVRAEKAALMLHDRSLTVHEIAEQIGMDTGNFIRLFTRHYGMTPARWREQHGSAPL